MTKIRRKNVLGRLGDDGWEVHCKYCPSHFIVLDRDSDETRHRIAPYVDAGVCHYCAEHVCVNCGYNGRDHGDGGACLFDASTFESYTDRWAQHG